MNGFILGFQRLVWCPKCTPASNNSGTNSVVVAIKQNATANAAAGQKRWYTGAKKANGMFIRFLTVRHCIFLDKTPQNPAKIGDPIQVTKYLRIQVLQLRNAALGATASGPCKVERGRRSV